mgnify:CR=1 FL=1
MTTEKITAKDLCEATTKYNTMPEDQMSIHGTYHAICYDANGNILEITGASNRRFTYDALNRLTVLETDGKEIHYLYDEQHRCIEKDRKSTRLNSSH